jgi:hypothetical protein
VGRCNDHEVLHSSKAVVATDSTEYFYLTDNLDATLQEDFKKEYGRRTMPWYGPAQLTDDWQPVDDGAGRNGKVNIGYDLNGGRDGG